MSRIHLGLIALFALVAGPVLVARSGGHHCHRCGCETQCEAVCRLVEEPRKQACYSCKCEDVCLPGPSKKCGHDCVPTCDGCVKVWIPQCGTIRPKAMLVKKEVESPKKNYKWVVEYVCPKCSQCDSCQHASTGSNAADVIAADVVADPNAEAPATVATSQKPSRVTKAGFFAPLLDAFK